MTISPSLLITQVCPVQEEDVGEAGANVEEAEAKYDFNKDYIIDAARVMAATGSARPNLQVGLSTILQKGVRKSQFEVLLAAQFMHP